MPRAYQVWLRQAVYDYLDALDLGEKQRLLTWLERLAQHPDRDGDFTERGTDGRDWQVAVIGAQAIVWWVDAPVYEVKVVAIRRADA